MSCKNNDRKENTLTVERIIQMDTLFLVADAMSLF